MDFYTGTIVEESLLDNRFLNELEITSIRISDADNPEDRWHLYGVTVTEDQVRQLAGQLKSEKWYAHFWDEEIIYVVFPGKTFKISRHDKTTWESAVNYGLSLNIPKEQLDFLINE